MLKAIYILTPSGKKYSFSKDIVNHKIVIDISVLTINERCSFDIIVEFYNTIREFRNHDYTWVTIDKDRMATDFSPKIIKLTDNCFVQANLNCGIWEIKNNNSNVLLWRFNPKNASPITTYSGKKNERIIVQANRNIDFLTNPALLFSTSGIEFSRSPIPFSAVACFTDHCDFDTTKNLKLQREFLNKNSIRITKGFFLNQYSKRGETVSFEKNEKELVAWKNDGHELAYHSLSQSLYPDKENIANFFSFKPPLNDISSYIDHGYQPYNFSLFQNYKIDEESFAANLHTKNITILWNYIDSGTATTGVINQMDGDSFTLDSFNQGNKGLPPKERMRHLLKSIMFHYYIDEKLIITYKKAKISLRKIIFKKDIQQVFLFLKSSIQLLVPIFNVLRRWSSNKNKRFELAKFTPIVFKHTIGKKEFYVFQTIEMLDFKKALDSITIDKLIQQKGMFIAHTYLSVPTSYYSGKLFKTSEVIDETVDRNFSYLSDKIKNKEIWNPTLNELVCFLSNFETTILDVDSTGKCSVSMGKGLPFRIVS